MPTIGTRTVNLFTVDKDSTTYAGPTHTVSHTDLVDLRRQLPATSDKPLRTNMRFERGFPVTIGGVTVEKPITISIAVTVPPGPVPDDVKSFATDTLTQAAAVMAELAISGDIHL